MKGINCIVGNMIKKIIVNTHDRKDNRVFNYLMFLLQNIAYERYIIYTGHK